MRSSQTAEKVLLLLGSFSSEHPELTVNQLADLLQVHKSTASRLAGTLAVRGFLERVPGSKMFRLGPELGRLGLLAWSGRDIITLARDPMERLAARTGETVNLAFLEGVEALNVAQVDGPHIVGIGFWTGRRTKLHPAAVGKIFLAFAGVDLGPGPYERYTERTLTTRPELGAELDRIRRDGWSSAVGELEAGLNAVAVPVFDALGLCRAALSVGGPSYRVPPERLPELARECKETANEIGLKLGAGAHAA